MDKPHERQEPTATRSRAEASENMAPRLPCGRVTPRPTKAGWLREPQHDENMRFRMRVRGIEGGPILPYQLVLPQSRGSRAQASLKVDFCRPVDQAQQFPRSAPRLEVAVAVQPLAEVFGLADIEHLAARVEEAVDPRILGQPCEKSTTDSPGQGIFPGDKPQLLRRCRRHAKTKQSLGHSADNQKVDRPHSGRNPAPFGRSWGCPEKSSPQGKLFF
jgi:hypothetical protein